MNTLLEPEIKARASDTTSGVTPPARERAFHFKPEDAFERITPLLLPAATQELGSQRTASRLGFVGKFFLYGTLIVITGLVGLFVLFSIFPPGC